MITPAPVTEFGPFWEIAKGVMLFVITTGVGFMVKLLWFVRDKVIEHDTTLYGRDKDNGLRGGLRGLTDRVGLIEDRNTAIDAVAAAERAQHQGPERRHAALRTLANLVRQELQEEGK
jgi:hypothetical protein